MSEDKCIRRVVGGRTTPLPNGGSITDHIFSTHHEWTQYMRGNSQDGFFCRFCLSTAYWSDKGVVIEMPAARTTEGQGE